MSSPDFLFLFRDQIPPHIPGFPHRLVLLPDGVTLDTLGLVQHASALFMIDPDCAHIALNDPALAGYLTARVPVLLHAAQHRDLKPFRRRAAAFKARGYTVTEVPGEARQ